MNRFLLGLAAGVIGTYAALKLVDQEAREEFCGEVEKATDKAREAVEKGLRTGRGRALRAGVVARKGYRDGKKKVNLMASEIAGKVIENLTELEARTRANANAK